MQGPRWIAVVSSAFLVLASVSCGDASTNSDSVASGIALASHADHVRPDPARKGPFEVGFASDVVVDPSREATSASHGRPIGIFIFYPVDRHDVSAGAALASYPLDPLYDTLPHATSANFEKYGVDRAWAAPPPSAAGPFPLVVFSPGWSSDANFYTYFGTRLASHGFVVAILTHDRDSLYYPWDLQDPLERVMLNRPRDESFALDHLLRRNRSHGDPLHRLIEPRRVAAAGHSLGGYAAMTLAGGDDVVCDFGLAPEWFVPPVTDPAACVPTLPDHRFGAIVSLDGSGWVLTFPELRRVDVPAILIGEEWDTLAAAIPEWSLFRTWHAREHLAISGQPNYRVDVSRTDHQSFSGFCEILYVWGDVGILDPDTVAFLVGPEVFNCLGKMPWTEAETIQTKYAIAFLERVLSDLPWCQYLLTPGWALRNEPDVEFFVTERWDPDDVTENWPPLEAYFAHQPGRTAPSPHRDVAMRGIGGLRMGLRPIR